MSVSAFVSIVSWISFIALTWLMIFNYKEEGRGVSPALGLTMFLVLGLIAMFSCHIEDEGKEVIQDES